MDVKERTSQVALGGSVLLAAAFLVVISVCAGTDWVMAFIGACGLVVAAVFGYLQWRVGQEMRRLTGQQTELTRQQVRMQDILRRVTTIPVLTPWSYKDQPGVLMLDNCGSGPAMDIRAYVLRPGPTPADPPERVFHVKRAGDRSHLGPGDSALRLGAKQIGEPVPGRQGADVFHVTRDDVWVIHCGDLNGWQWHAWSQWTRENQYRPGEPFIFESKERTPDWIRDHCPRCREIAEIRAQEEASG